MATAEEARRAKLEPLPKSRLPIAAERIQAADAAAKHGSAREHLDKYGRFRSTLDADKQNILLAELRAALANMDEGVTAAAVLVENKTAKVRGYVGNAREGTGRAGRVGGLRSLAALSRLGAQALHIRARL